MPLNNKLFSQIPVSEEYIYIAGWKEVSLVDVIDHSSFTLWTSYCNFNCPWCSNSALAKGLERKRVHVKEIISAVKNAADFVDFFHVTGGEPTLQYRPLAYLLRYSREKLGLRTSIATNGSNPYVISKLTSILDHVALDVKAPLNDIGKYSKVIGLPESLTKLFIPRIVESIEASMKTSFLELRTTMVPDLIDVEDIRKIAVILKKFISKAKGRVVFVIQQFIPYEKILNEKYREMKRTEPEKVIEAAEVAAEILPIQVYCRTLEFGTKQV